MTSQTTNTQKHKVQEKVDKYCMQQWRVGGVKGGVEEKCSSAWSPAS